MKAEMKHAASPASVYLVDSRLGLAKIGVAPDPSQRLRELQVGSPVRLELALAAPYAEREDARAVADELARRFAARRAHGHWYRVTAAEVRRALASKAIREAPATAARARAAAAAAAAAGEGRLARGPRRGARPRTEKELAYQRRRRRARAAKQKRAAKLLAQEMTQLAAAAAVGVTARTLRSWSRSPAFTRALERERERASAGSARTKPSRRLRTPAADDAERVPGQRQRERHEPPPPSGPRPRQPSSARLGPGGVPLFPNTRAGQTERLAYYEARKLNQLPDSLLDYNDVLRGRETPAERRARERGASGPRR